MLHKVEIEAAQAAFPMHPVETSPVDDPAEDRPMREALLRGWRCRCPNCGAGMSLDALIAHEECRQLLAG